MGRGWRPVLAGGAIAVATFGLAQAAIFAPSTPSGASVTGGDVHRGATVFQRECAKCHGEGGVGGGVGPRLVASGVTASDVVAAVREGRGVMPAGLVTGAEETDVVAYVVSVSSADQ